MTATISSPDVRRALDRTWKRLAKVAGEEPLPDHWLDALAAAAEAQLKGKQGDATQLVDEVSRWEECAGGQAEQIERLQAELDQANKAAADNALEWQKTSARQADEIIDLRADLTDRDKENAKLADKIEAQQRELEQLGQQAKAKPAHGWPLDPTTGEYGLCQCGCGRPWPRLLEDDPTDVPTVEVEPLDGLMQRLRSELTEAGFPEARDA